jgi:hypothetical protein
MAIMAMNYKTAVTTTVSTALTLIPNLLGGGFRTIAMGTPRLVRPSAPA